MLDLMEKCPDLVGKC